jgi:hypothetical protein
MYFLSKKYHSSEASSFNTLWNVTSDKYKETYSSGQHSNQGELGHMVEGCPVSICASMLGVIAWWLSGSQRLCFDTRL